MASRKPKSSSGRSKSRAPTKAVGKGLAQKSVADVDTLKPTNEKLKSSISSALDKKPSSAIEKSSMSLSGSSADSKNSFADTAAPKFKELQVGSTLSAGDDAGAALKKTAPKEAEKKLKEDLTKRPASSLQSKLRIFQIYYEAWQRELLDPNFIPLDNSKSRSELLEFSVFERLATSDYVKGAGLWGAVSWRFVEKTGMSGGDWVKAIVAHPGYDVYFCDPNPQNEALFHNLWMQGETSHPQFLAICQAVFKVVGLPLEELTSILPSDKYSTTNCFIATPQFWTAYLQWIKKVLTLADKKLPPKVRDLLHSKHADDRGLHKGASYIPFIVERLFPVFMKTAGKNMKGYKIALPERERELNVHLKLLREMKDLSHRTKSAWLAACWVNYRNLYLTQAQNKEWCGKYLATLSPPEIKFS